MIDNQQDVAALIKALNDHLPMRAYATASLVMSIRQQGAQIEANDVVQIDSVLNLGDEGGITCGIGVIGGKTAVLTSLTHLRVDPAHPLAQRIRDYQFQRLQQLSRAADSSSRSSRPQAAAKSNRAVVRGDRVKDTRPRDRGQPFQS
ncbi:MAG: hypothetical protein EHM42_13175, partial [Planctomycetaceae bacterium]